MSDYRCEICRISYTKEIKDKSINFLNKYHCKCGRNVCNSCIEHNDDYDDDDHDDNIKCYECANIPTNIRDLEFDCVCEICKYYDGDGHAIRLKENKDGVCLYMCSCCINGCYKISDDDRCRCNDSDLEYSNEEESEEDTLNEESTEIIIQ